MPSRKLTDLASEVRPLVVNFLALCREDPWFIKNKITVLVTCTFRSMAEQAATFAQGRTVEQLAAAGLPDVAPRPGKIVTWAVPGKSRHNKTDGRGLPASEAVDVVPARNGVAIWGVNGDGIDDIDADDMTDDLEVWERVGVHGEAAGLAWAGRWPKGKKEFPHFQKRSTS